MSGPRVAAVVLTKDGGEHLEPGIEALVRARPAGGLEVVLVDNGSVDGSAGRIQRLFPEVRVVRHERNFGFARGVRTGSASTEAPILVLLNDDAIVEPGSVEALVDALETAPPEAVAAAGMLTDASGERVDFVEGIVTFDGHALQRGFGQPAGHLRAGARGEPRLFPCGGFCAVRRRDFELLGGFDDDFFAYLEDVDFGWRASLKGRTTFFVPEARARHLSGATGRRLGLAMRGVLFESNAFATAYKNLGDSTLAALLPAILATFQHRVLRGLLENEPAAAAAFDDPFREGLPAAPASSLSRLVAALTGVRETWGAAGPPGPGRPFGVQNETARMWLVAWNRIVAAWPRLVEKRGQVQAGRRVSDEELFARFPLHLVPTYPGDEALFSSPFFASLLPEDPRLVRTTLENVARGVSS